MFYGNHYILKRLKKSIFILDKSSLFTDYYTKGIISSQEKSMVTNKKAVQFLIDKTFPLISETVERNEMYKYY